jgi:carbon monoxide dehydrogenase subunit G
MAMTMTGEVELAASREVVWAKLNDPEVLKVCIPGCEELNKFSDTEFQAVATTKIGPVKARFKGKVHLTDLNPPNGYRISARATGALPALPKAGRPFRSPKRTAARY